LIGFPGTTVEVYLNLTVNTRPPNYGDSSPKLVRPSALCGHS
jgi:hypothetical protein